MPFVRRAVTRFMPGERVEDAIAAAAVLRERGLGAVLTRLGENVSDDAAAVAAARHYSAIWAQLRPRALDCDVSVKLTQLGLDIDEAQCYENLVSVVRQAALHDRFVWIDMEQSPYVDRTLDIYRRTLRDFANVGVCLQAYLYRTAGDLASLAGLGGGVRLVKGAYAEPATAAYPRKSDVDANFFGLVTRMLEPDARAAGLHAVFGTHDVRLIRRIQRYADSMRVGREAYEFHLLFGVRHAQQVRLSEEGHRVRVLISYGDEWFPWYMRRLAERPANLWFVATSVLSK